MLAPLSRVPIEQRAMRNISPDSSPISCFCCRDSALLPTWIVQAYVMREYDLTDWPIVCQRVGCGARSIWVDTAEGGAQKRVDRFDVMRLDLRLKPASCQSIHLAERDRIQRIIQEPDELRSMPDLSGVARSMPSAEPPSDSELEHRKLEALADLTKAMGEAETWH